MGCSFVAALHPHDRGDLAHDVHAAQLVHRGAERGVGRGVRDDDELGVRPGGRLLAPHLRGPRVHVRNACCGSDGSAEHGPHARGGRQLAQCRRQAAASASNATGWLNFTRPDVRRFVGDLMLEAVSRYGVDGVHFDYTRYPGGAWGFDGRWRTYLAVGTTFK